MKKFSPEITKEHIEKIVSEVDKDNSGKISIDGIKQLNITYALLVNDSNFYFLYYILEFITLMQ